MSGSYKLNGTELTMQPTTGKWLPRQVLGIDGNGHAVYAGVREFEMRFNIQSPAEYNQLVTFFNAYQPSGSVIVDLPGFGTNIYNFVSYSGCNIREPEIGEYFNEYHQEILLLVSNVRT